MENNYVVYHLHSDISNGVTSIDSVTKFTQYVQRAKECGMKALAFSEHGSVMNWLNKKEEIEAQGMKYIHAEEFYICNELFREIDDKRVRENFHVVLIAKNYDGVLELNQLSSKAFNREDGHFYFLPRITMSELENTSDNIMVTTACLASPLNKGYEEIRKRFFNFIITHKDRCYLEIQHHNVKDQIGYNIYLYNLHLSYDIPMIAGTDTHALNDEHAKARVVLQRAKNVYFEGEDGWDLTWKTYDELVDAYQTQNAIPMDAVLEAIDNTNKMADRVEEFTVNRDKKYPKLWDNPEKTLQEDINKGIERRGIKKYPNYKEYIDRIRYEYSVFKHNGAIDFILLMVDVVNYCREHDIQLGYGRGSVNGSVICWILGITEMDSIKFGLNFERFMNTERVSLADIDSDIPPNRRDELIDYLFNRKGLYCSDIITFNTIALKGSVRDICRALYKDSQYDYMEITDEISDNIDTDEQKMRAKYPDVFEYADIVSGVIVSIGVHPCLLSGTKVLTDNGYKNIEDINIKDKVFTHNNRYESVLNVMTHNEDGWFEINAFGAMPIKATYNHPFYVRKKIKKQFYKKLGDNYDNPNWINAEDIHNGDMVGIPLNSDSIIPINNPTNLPFDNEDFWWIIGRYIGDGYYVEIQRGKHWLQQNIYICHGYNDKSAKYIYDKLNNCGVEYTLKHGRTAMEISFKSEYTKKWIDFIKRFGKYAYGKKIPNEVMSLPVNLLKAFLEGYLSADGYYNGKVYECTTISYDLALGLSLCISKVYKVNCNITTRNKRNGMIDGRIIHCKDIYRLQFTPNPKNYNSVYDKKNNYLWCIVKSVKYHDEKVPVYNLSVNIDNSYTANNIAVHNCGRLVVDHPIDGEVGLCSTSTDSHMISQLWMHELDSMNYVKLDLLALDTIELITDTCKLAHIPMLLPSTMDVTDEKVWKSIRDDTTCIFQWESDTASDYISKLLSDSTIGRFKHLNENVDKMELLTIGNSAIRPAGASYRDDLANGVIRSTGDRAIDDFLKPTFGYLVYQCQIIDFLHQYCGFTMGQADVVRRGFAKKSGTGQFIPVIKDGGYMPKDNKHEHYIDGFIKTMNDKYHMDKETAEKDIVAFLQVIQDASSYLFSRNHSTPYSFEGYASGWLRYYYPVEFLTVALSINKDKKEKTTALTNYTYKQGIKIKNPVFRYAKSDYFCDAPKRIIYKGIGSIKDIGEQTGDKLYELKNGQYESFIDVLDSIKENKSCNSREIKILLAIDYFKEFGNPIQLKKKYDAYCYYSKYKTFKKDKLNKNQMTIIGRYAQKETDKQYSQISDYNSMIKDLTANINDTTDFIQYVSFDLTCLGYSDRIDNRCKLFGVKNIEVNQYGTTMIELYSLQNGHSKTFKLSRKWENKCEQGDILRVAFENKVKYIKNDNGQWVPNPNGETELRIKLFNVVYNSADFFR